MKGLIWIVVLFALAVAAVLGVQYYSGDVYLLSGDYLIRVNMHLFAAGVLLLVVLLYVLLALFGRFVGLPTRLSRYLAGRREKRSGNLLNKAGLAYFEGKFSRSSALAEKVLRGRDGKGNKALALMLAAYASDGAGDTAGRTRYLELLGRLPEKQQLARHLLAAEAALEKQDYDAAAAALAAASAIDGRLTALVRLQLRLAQACGHGGDMLDAAARLHCSGALGEAEYRSYAEAAYRLMLDGVWDSDSLKQALRQIPADDREGGIGAEIARKLADLGFYGRAVKWVKQYYPKQHDTALLPVLLQSFRFLGDKDRQKIIDTAESWLKNRPDDADLLLCLTQMACEQELWGKAGGYAQAVLALREDIRARLLLAKIFEKSGRHDDAEAQRRQVLADVGDEDTAED